MPFAFHGAIACMLRVIVLCMCKCMCMCRAGAVSGDVCACTRCRFFTDIFSMRLLQHLVRCFYMRRLLCTLLDLSILGFLRVTSYGVFFFPLCFFPLLFLFFYYLFYFPDLPLLGFWFRFKFISQLYRVSPFLSGFPLYGPYTRIIIKILI